MTAARELPGWIADHMRRYLETDGREGHIWNGVPCLLLTTTGRKSKTPQMLPLIYGRDGDRYLIVASKGGDAKHPGWYLNLTSDSNVRLQVGAERFAARAHTADAKEKKRLWPIMTKIWPAYDEYQAKTPRDIPVVILDPVR